jgi:hypothetical protein
MKRRIVVLTMGLWLFMPVIAEAQVPPPWPMFAGQSMGSDNWWADPVRREFFFNETAFSGFIGTPTGGIYGLTLNSIAQGATLTNFAPQFYNHYVPNYLYCIEDALGITAGFCAKDFRFGATAVYAPFDYGAPSRLPNSGDVAVLSTIPAAFGGGVMNPGTSLWPNAGMVVSGINNFAVNPYGGIPFKGMQVVMASYRDQVADMGPPRNQIGYIDQVASQIKVNFYIGKNYIKTPTSMKGNFIRVGSLTALASDRGAPIIVSTKDANGNPCASMLGLVESTGVRYKAWAENYLTTVVPAARSVIPGNPALEVGGGNCRAVSPPGVVPLLGGVNLSGAQLANATAAYANVQSALAATSSPGTQWMDVISDVDPNIVSVGYSDNGDPTQPVVQITYACEPGQHCPGAPDVQRSILSAVDVNNPGGGTVSAWLSSQHVAGLQVEVLSPVNGVADDNSVAPNVGTY